jgi:hypothetical protein
MKAFGFLIAVLFALSAETTASTPARHLVYRFGYNTKVANSGNGTGTTTVDILGPAADGGVMISGTDDWWNSARPRATNTCEVYPNGGVSCARAPYAISPMQLTLFPLLAGKYFSGLAAGPTSGWTKNNEVKAAIVPGAAGFAGKLTTWKCQFTLSGKGPIAGSEHLILVHQNGTMNQQGGTYLKATVKGSVAYDPVQKVPAFVDQVRTHLPQRTVENYDTIQLKLTTISPRY